MKTLTFLLLTVLTPSYVPHLHHPELLSQLRPFILCPLNFEENKHTQSLKNTQPFSSQQIQKKAFFRFAFAGTCQQ